MEITLKKLIEKINNVHQTIQEDVIKSVSSGLTLRNWIIGYYIVEYEQKGSDKAKYGDKIINNLVSNLKHIKGMSLSNIKSFRQFYLTYPQLSQSVSGFLKIENIKSQSVTGESKSIPVKKLLNRFTFTHFVELMRLDDDLKRVFYEVEAIKGNWSVRELKRQINSQIFERTGLSTNKKELIKSLNFTNEISETNDNPPIGLILCANKNNTKVEYATAGLDNNLFVSKYKIKLPSVKEIEDFIEDELENLEGKVNE